MNNKVVIGVAKLAEILEVNAMTIYRYCDKGMPYNQLGRKRTFDLEKVNAWLLGEGE